MSFFTYLGMVAAALIAVVLLVVAKELLWLLYRAGLQTRRIVEVMLNNGASKPPLRVVLGLFFHEIFSSYTTLRLHNATLPYDPRKPMSESYPG